jgi:hypothetical protein
MFVPGKYIIDRPLHMVVILALISTTVGSRVLRHANSGTKGPTRQAVNSLIMPFSSLTALNLHAYLRNQAQFALLHLRQSKRRSTMATIIENGGGAGGSGAGILAGVLLVVVVVIGFLVFANNHGGGSGSVDIDVPKVNVNVVPDGQ